MARPDGARNARRAPTRLLGIVAVAAALAVMLAPLCLDAMADAGMHLVDASSTTDQTVADRPHSTHARSTGPCELGEDRDAPACDSTAPTLSPSAIGSPASAPVAAVVACFAVILATLAAARGLRSPPSHRFAMPRQAMTRTLRSRPARRPALAELCVLRT